MYSPDPASVTAQGVLCLPGQKWDLQVQSWQMEGGLISTGARGCDMDPPVIMQLP